MKHFFLKNLVANIFFLAITLPAAAVANTEIVFRGEAADMQPGSLVLVSHGREMNLVLPRISMRFDGVRIGAPDKLYLTVEYSGADTQGPASYQMSNVHVDVDPKDTADFSLSCTPTEGSDVFNFGGPISDCQVVLPEGNKWSVKMYERMSKDIYDALNIKLSMTLRGKRETVVKNPPTEVQVQLDLQRLASSAKTYLSSLKFIESDEQAVHKSAVYAAVMSELGLDFCKQTNSQLAEKLLLGSTITDNRYLPGGYYNATIFESDDKEKTLCSQISNIDFESKAASYRKLREELYEKATEQLTTKVSGEYLKIKDDLSSRRLAIPFVLESKVDGTSYVDESVELNFTPEFTLRN